MFQATLRSLILAFVLATLCWPTQARAAGAAFEMAEASFDLPLVQGNPFDFTQNDVQVNFIAPDGQRLMLPAFFDGDKKWRVRITPQMPGKYSIQSITLNGRDAKPQNLDRHDFNATGSTKPGFVRIDPNNSMRFVLDDGSPYYPLGYNLGWRDASLPSIPDTLAEMGKAGVNWSRIWMCAWDGKNLDWSDKPKDQPALGTLNLSTARFWDQIVGAAQANGVYFQLVLQHHGQFSTRADSNWATNPWNKANKGGWLENPVQFFSDPKAMALTRSKFRYIIARWGYSPSIMSWELFNEIEQTDAYESDLDAVGAWHSQMARFIRQQDPYKHLITTSSRLSDPRIWTAVDYYDAHVYAPDPLAAMSALDAENLKRPYFYGEIGGSTGGGASEGEETLRKILWGSLTSGASGAAQYWYWDVVQRSNLFHDFTAAKKFVDQSGLLRQSDMHPIEVGVQTSDLGPLRFGAGVEWGAWKGTDFTINRSGIINGLGNMSAYLTGASHREMFSYASFKVDFPTAGTFSIRVDQITPKGGRLEASLDGKPTASVNFQAPPPAPGFAGQNRPQRNIRLDETLELPIPAGQHTIRLENNGDDWIHVREYVLNPYAPQLAVYAKANKNFALLWVHRREQGDDKPISGTLQIPGLADGPYHIVWWNTSSGTVVHDETAQVAAGAALTLTTPPIEQDIALWVTPGQ